MFFKNFGPILLRVRALPAPGASGALVMSRDPLDDVRSRDYQYYARLFFVFTRIKQIL